MNKPVPWNVKGVGFDAREAARMAARRAGVPLGEWLNSVISERAAELGVRTDDIDPDERLEAIAARLSAADHAPAASVLPRSILAGAGAPMPEGRGRVPRAAGRDDVQRDLDQELVYASEPEAFAKPPSAGEARHEVNRTPTQRQAIGHRRSGSADNEGDQILVEADLPARTLPANTTRNTRGSGSTTRDRSPEPAEGQVRPLPRGGTPHARVSPPERPRRGTAPANQTANEERLDTRLTSILDKLNRSFEEAERFGAAVAAERGPRHALPPTKTSPNLSHVFDEAVTAISRRQASLNTAEQKASVYDRRRDPLDRAEDRNRGTISEAQAAPPEPSPGSAAAFAELHAAFKTLAKKLDARLAEPPPVREPAAQSSGQSAEFKSLQTDIAGLAQRIDRLNSEAAGRETTQGRGEVEVLRREIAQLSGSLAELAPQRSLDSLEGAVRELVGRVDLSKLDGVQASVLAPVERLSRELRDAIRSVDPSQTVDALRHDMQTLATTVDEMRRHTVDPQVLARVQDETHDMREMLIATSERFMMTDGLTKELAKLGERVEQLADRSTPTLSRDLAQGVNEIRILLHRLAPDGILGAIDRKIDALAARVDSRQETEAHVDMFDDLSRQIDRAHESLASRLSEREVEPVNLAPLEDRIGVLSAKLDTFGRSSQDVNALYGLVGGLVDRIEEARNPQAETEILNTLQAQIGLLVERLDRSENSHATLAGLEQSIGDLFLQIEQSRNIAIDAAENAARTAAHDTLRAAMDNPTLNGAELTVQTGMDVDHVSVELAELRRAQETSERRVNATLNALNTTLERLVDRMVQDSARPVSKAATPAADPRSPGDENFGASTNKRRPQRGLSEALRTSQSDAVTPKTFDPDTFLLGPGSTPKSDRLRRPDEASTVHEPALDVGQIDQGMTAAEVAPLIAAARRAAKAAQVSARDVAPRTNNAADAPPADTASTSKTRSFFAQRGRPLLLGLAGLVLLLGTLQIAKISLTAGTPTAASSADDAPEAPAAEKPVSKPAPAPSRSEAPNLKSIPPAASLLTPPSANASVSTSFNTSAMPALPPDAAQSMSLATSTADAALNGLSQGLHDMATSGNAAAEFEIAVRLSEGRTVARDPKSALSWFQRAAQQGLAPAQYRLGSLYEKGIGVTADPALAVAWYERAAAQGNVRAMHNLAVMSAEGGGSKPDYAKAVAWFLKAANYGVRDSQFNLAVLYARGLGAAQSLTQSYSWFAIAAGQGDNDAAQKRDSVAAKLDAKSLTDAKATVDSFKPLTPQPGANDVVAPPGGWDAAAPAKTAMGIGKDTARLSSM